LSNITSQVEAAARAAKVRAFTDYRALIVKIASTPEDRVIEPGSIEACVDLLAKTGLEGGVAGHVAAYKTLWTLTDADKAAKAALVASGNDARIVELRKAEKEQHEAFEKQRQAHQAVVDGINIEVNKIVVARRAAEAAASALASHKAQHFQLIT
jgi:hypothetical protein